MAFVRLPNPPTSMPVVYQNYLNELIRAIQFNLNSLNSNAGIFGSVTLTPGVASTVVSNRSILATDTVVLTPTTADAALDISSGDFYVVAASGSFTIYHENTGAIDRTFNYAITR